MPKKIPTQLEPHAFKPGESGNPSGRPPGPSKQAKRLSLAMVAYARADCPDEWLVDGLGGYKGHGLTVEQVIALRITHALATNTQYKNSALLVETLNRTEGKLASKYVHKSKDEADDEVTRMSEEELISYIAGMTQKANETQKQLTEGTNAEEASQ
jgi:uncharacterized protein DUF5681